MSSLGPNGEEIPDGFRAPKRRGKNWLAKAIKDGSVRAEGAPDPDEGKDYRDATVVSLEVAKRDDPDFGHLWQPGDAPEDYDPSDLMRVPGVAGAAVQGA